MHTGWATLALSAMDALTALTPGGVLFFVEGTGQNLLGLNWGKRICHRPQSVAVKTKLIRPQRLFPSPGHEKLSQPGDFHAPLLPSLHHTQHLAGERPVVHEHCVIWLP